MTTCFEQVEWDTDPGTQEIQWIKTYADTGPNEIQAITTSAADVDEVQRLTTSANETQEVQVSLKHLVGKSAQNVAAWFACVLLPL